MSIVKNWGEMAMWVCAFSWVNSFPGNASQSSKTALKLRC
jgi:hypothetical protein